MLFRSESDLQNDSANVVDIPIMVPGKTEPHAVFNNLGDWADALEDLFDKTARAGKRPVRERMTILKELRQLNEENLQRVELAKKAALIAMYGKRIRALGANLTDEEREAEKKTPA